MNAPQKPGVDIIKFYDEKFYVAGLLQKTDIETIRAIKQTLSYEYKTMLACWDGYDLDMFFEKLKEVDTIWA